MTIPFEFFIDGPPVSQQTRRRSRLREWKQELHRTASRSWDADQPVEGPVAVTITYFFDGVSGDIDNIPKPILDALKGMVYADDRQVFDLVCRKRDLTDLQVREPSQDLYEYIANTKQFLHISVVNLLNFEVAL